MIDIKIDERSIFTYSYEELCVGGWYHRDGIWKGDVCGPTWFISFPDIRTVKHFREMLDYMIEKDEKEKGISYD